MLLGVEHVFRRASLGSGTLHMMIIWLAQQIRMQMVFYLAFCCIAKSLAYVMQNYIA